MPPARGGYDVLATGHNLDDEAAVLLGNTLRWQTEYLGRQMPVLDAHDGFGRKVKPLVFLSERETAAYCLLRGIDYMVDECPIAAGNKHLTYKAILNDIEIRSPGTKHDFYFGFLARASERFRSSTDVEPVGVVPLLFMRGARQRRHVCFLSSRGAGDRTRARALHLRTTAMTELGGLRSELVARRDSGPPT